MQIFATPSVVTEKYSAVHLSDAQACIYAGTAYSMSSGKPAIVICNGVEESLRACAGALTPWGDKIPLFILCSVNEKEIKKIKTSFSAVSRQIYVCHSINDLQLIPDRFSEFPVTILCSQNFPINDVLAKIKECGIEEEDVSKEPEIDRVIKEVIKEIEKSKRPVILAGRGAINTIEKALELGDRIKAPLLLTAGATTMPAEKIEMLRSEKGLVIPSGNPIWLNAFVSADLILALGTAFSEVDWFGLKSIRIHRGRVVNVSNQNTPGKLADISLKINLNKFFLKISGVKGCTGRKFYDMMMRKCARYREILKREVEGLKHKTPLHPSLVAHEIVERSPSGTIFVSEGGACGMWMWMHLWLKPFVFPVQNGTIGVSIPMTCGIKSYYPHRNVWAVIGDGAFFYHLSELESLNKNGLNAVFFIFNDSSWGAIRLAQTFIYRENYIGTDIVDIDYAKIAEIYGVEGITVRTYEELINAIEFAKSVKNILVVDVKIKRDSVPASGGNFVAAEFDGVLKFLLPGLITSFVKNVAHRKIPRDLIRILIKSML